MLKETQIYVNKKNKSAGLGWAGPTIVQARPSDWRAYKKFVQAWPLGFLGKTKALILWAFWGEGWAGRFMS